MKHSVSCPHWLTYAKERRALQIVTGLAVCVPLIAGFSGMLMGTSLFDTTDNVSLDSHLRYLSGLLFGIGLCFVAIIPTIEHHVLPVRMLTFLVVIGGIARLTAAVTIALPSIEMQAAIGMELLVTPLLCLWQGRIARLSHRQKPIPRMVEGDNKN